MATELGKAYIQIIPSAKGIGGAISKELGGEAGSAGKSAGLNIAGAIKGAIAAAGIGTAIKETLEAGGNLQQSFGGLDTLYGKASDAAKQYAVDAAKAGISANSYAEQAVSFGAALKSAFENDVSKAAVAANTAILDMADNSAKLGTPIEQIQSAYAGFSKGQYQLLDNLKLGYGGTKSEMERLLARASEISKVEYNIDNLGDVYEAIHVIQEDLGLTGVAAAEASTTFSGSLGAMKAAGENLLANLALGEDIGPSLDALGSTVETFLFNNLFPMIGNILSQIPNLLSGLSSFIIQALNQISNNAPEIAQQGISIITALVEGIFSALPYLLEAALRLIVEFGKALINTDWGAIGTNLLNNLGNAMDLAAGEIFGSDTSIIDGILSGISNALPLILDSAVNIISSLVNGLLSSLPSLISTASSLINFLAVFLMENGPKITMAGIDLIFKLAQGLISNLPEIIKSVQTMIRSFVSTITSNLPTIISQGVMIVGKLVSGLIQSIPTIVSAIPRLVSAIVNGFKEFNWLSIGSDIIKGIAQGLKDAAGIIKDAAKDAAKKAFDAAKDFLGISSPAKKGIYIGDMYDAGIAEGITRNQSIIDNAISDLNKKSFSGIQTSASYNFEKQSADDSKIDLLISLLEIYLPQIAQREGVDVNQLFNGINRQLGWGLQ
ncbi:MAG: hypothetical protein IKQ00_00045 [Butyrivibrio sp.]|nr:hypothetical protein [Butyrivibrio sp.]